MTCVICEEGQTISFLNIHANPNLPILHFRQNVHAEKKLANVKIYMCMLSVPFIFCS
jgi:hypothetical protein